LAQSNEFSQFVAPLAINNGMSDASLKRIAVDAGIHFGKPCVVGTRITVQDVLELVREGIGFDLIVKDYYPDLELDDVRACVQYAIDVVAIEDIHLAPTDK
jgi:uncharacterized protein (DUF433 family)